MKKLTIKEIAKMSGVSPAAVSFVINHKDGVSEETRKKVQAVIEKTNFVPSLNSRRLSLKKSYNISLAISQSSSPFADLFYFEVVKGILEKSKEFGYNLVFVDIGLKDGMVEIPQMMKQGDTDGIIFFQDMELIILQKMDALGIPFVIVDAHMPYENAVCVNSDYTSSVYTATRYLIDKGHRDIAFIGSSHIPQYYAQAHQGYKKAMDEIHASPPSLWVQNAARDEETGYMCMENILSGKEVPTAVFCAGDIFAVGAMRCAKAHGYSIPNDISFIGIDDILLSKYVEPALTTIFIDKIQMGMHAMELLVRQINEEPAQSIFIEPNQIIERDSVRDIG